jgi:WD40 repeat protein
MTLRIGESWLRRVTGWLRLGSDRSLVKYLLFMLVPALLLTSLLVARPEPVQTWIVENARVVEYSPDGELLAVAGGPLQRVVLEPQTTADLWSKVELRRVLDGQVIHSLTAFGVRSVAFSADGALLVTGGIDSTVRVWRARDGTLLSSFRTPWEIMSAAISPDSELIVAGGISTSIPIWRLHDGMLIHELKDDALIERIAFSPDGQWLVGGGSTDHTILWRVSDWQAVRKLEGGQPFAIAFSPDGRHLAIGSVAAQVIDNGTDVRG